MAKSMKPIIVLPTALMAAVLFYEDRRHRSQPLAPNAFDAQALDRWTDAALDSISDDDDNDDELVKGPGKLKLDDFMTWKESLDLKLRSMCGVSGVPL